MHVFEAWLIYLIVVAVIWIVLVGVDAFHRMSQATKFFLALLAGALVVFFFTASVETACPDDRFWFMLLLLLAYLAPLIIGLWLLFTGGWETMRGLANGSCEPKVDRTYACEGSHCYPVITKIKGKTGETTIFHT